MYYNVECELSRHRAVITVWDRPGFAAKPPSVCPPASPSVRSIQPHRLTGPDNERVITPRWPTAVLLERESGQAAFPGGDYYSFYSRARPLFRAGPITIPLTRPLYCPPHTPVEPPFDPARARAHDVRCIQRPHCFLPPFRRPALPLLSSLLLPFHFLRFSIELKYLWIFVREFFSQAG